MFGMLIKCENKNWLRKIGKKVYLGSSELGDYILILSLDF